MSNLKDITTNIVSNTKICQNIIKPATNFGTINY